MFISRVGSDSFGKGFQENFRSLDIVGDGVIETPGVSTGVAAISVDAEGRNSIVIVGGANDRLTTEDVEAQLAVISRAKVMVCQLEVSPATTLSALRVAKAAGLTTIFNPAPAPESLESDFYKLTDIFCVNETEAETLSGN
jgi:ribokinase